MTKEVFEVFCASGNHHVPRTVATRNRRFHICNACLHKVKANVNASMEKDKLYAGMDKQPTAPRKPPAHAAWRPWHTPILHIK